MKPIPCRHCGEKPKITKPGYYYEIFCLGCNIANGFTEPTRYRAIKEWNEWHSNPNAYLDKLKTINVSPKATPTRKRGSK